MKASELSGPWDLAFNSDDPTVGGCPTQVLPADFKLF